MLLAITAAGVVVAVWWGRSHRGTPRELAVRRGFAVVSLAVVLGMQVYFLTPDVRDVHSSWPLQLSDLADYTAVFALWTRGPRTAAFTYYVGLSLTLMAVLTPSLGQSFPDPRWFGFWIRHIFVVWTAVYLVWGLGMRPTWRLYRTTLVGAPRLGCGGLHLQRRHGHQLRLPRAHAGCGHPARLVRAVALVPPGCGSGAPDPVGAGLHAALGAREATGGPGPEPVTLDPR